MTGAICATLALAALVAAAGPAEAGAAAPPPIIMTMTTQGPGIRLTVRGAATSPVDAAYALDVSSNAASGKNHSVQRGRVRLLPGKTVTLMTLDLANLGAASWTATLQVDPVGASSYRQALGSDAPQAKSPAD